MYRRHWQNSQAKLRRRRELAAAQQRENAATYGEVLGAGGHGGNLGKDPLDDSDDDPLGGGSEMRGAGSASPKPGSPSLLPELDIAAKSAAPPTSSGPHNPMPQSPGRARIYSGAFHFDDAAYHQEQAALHGRHTESTVYRYDVEAMYHDDDL